MSEYIPPAKLAEKLEGMEIDEHQLACSYQYISQSVTSSSSSSSSSWQALAPKAMVAGEPTPAIHPAAPPSSPTTGVSIYTEEGLLKLQNVPSYGDCQPFLTPKSEGEGEGESSVFTFPTTQPSTSTSSVFTTTQPYKPIYPGSIFTFPLPTLPAPLRPSRTRRSAQNARRLTGRKLTVFKDWYSSGRFLSAGEKKPFIEPDSMAEWEEFSVEFFDPNGEKGDRRWAKFLREWKAQTDRRDRDRTRDPTRAHKQPSSQPAHLRTASTEGCCSDTDCRERLEELNDDEEEDMCELLLRQTALRAEGGEEEVQG